MREVEFLGTLTLFCLCFSSTVAIACGDNEYIHDGRCCEKCARGFYVDEHCHNDTTPTRCHPCEGMTFARESNSNTQCSPCYRGPCKIPGMYLKIMCDGVIDNTCHCPDKQYYSEALLGCTQCQPCPAGRFSPNVCKSSTICRDCPKGHYSNRTKNYRPGCTKCRQCTKYKRGCNTTHDAICDVITTAMPTTDGSISEGTSTKENDVTEASAEQGSFDYFHKVLIAVIVIVLVLLLCLTVCYIVKRKQKVVCQGPRWKSIPDESGTYETLNTGLLLREQPANLLYKLHEYLNPPGHKNWKTLAAAMGFKHIEISNFAVDAGTSAERMLASWQTKDNATVDVLHHFLIQIGRDDAAKFLRENVVVNETESLV